MKKKEKIEEQIRMTLDQFDQADQLPPNPYFYTRVQARLDENRRQKHVVFGVLRPALLATLIVINVTTVGWYLGIADQAEQSDSRQDLVELLSGDFNPENDQNDLLNLK